MSTTSTERTRKFRAENPEHNRTYQREYKRRLRAKRKAENANSRTD